MAGTSKPKASASSKGKGKEIVSVEEDSRPDVLGRRRRRRRSNATQAVPQLPICNCKNESTQHHAIHQAFEKLVSSLRDRFQQHEPHVFDACCKILQQFTVDEMEGREAFDRLNCILVNEPDLLKEATGMFTVYMSLGECLKRHMDIAPMDTTTFDRILDFYGY